MNIKSIEDLPRPGKHGIIIDMDELQAAKLVCEKLGELNWHWSSKEHPSARLGSPIYRYIWLDDTGGYLKHNHPHGISGTTIVLIASELVNRTNTCVKQTKIPVVDLCPHCNIPMNFVNLGFRCDKCWFTP